MQSSFDDDLTADLSDRPASTARSDGAWSHAGGAVTTAVPPWRGEPAPGRTLLVRAGPDLGEDLLLVRLLPGVAARVGRLMFAAPPELRELVDGAAPFRSGPGSDEPAAGLLIDSDAPPPHDLETDLAALPRLLGLEAAALATTVPYVAAESGRVDIWRARLSSQAASRLRVGLARRHSADDTSAECVVPASAAAMFARLSPRVAFFAIGEEGQGQEPGHAGFSPVPLSRLSPGGAPGWSDLAAILCGLDLLITDDETLAHLAGALGRPVWLMLGNDPGARWGEDGQLIPAYPTMRLFRERAGGGRGEEYAVAAAELEVVADLARSGAANPADGDALAVSAMARFSAGGRDGATARAVLLVLLRSVALAPRVSDRWSDLAIVLERCGYEVDCRRALDLALAFNPHHGAAQIALASRDIEAGEPAAALKRIDQVLVTDREFANALMVRAKAFTALGENERAEIALRQAVLREPENTRYLAEWARALAAIGDRKGAIRAWERTLAADADNAEAMRRLGIEEREHGEPGLGLYFLRAAVMAAPGNAGVLTDLAMAAFAAGRDKEAIDVCRQALAIDPSDLATHATLGRALLRSGDYAEGFREYARRNTGAELAETPIWTGEDPRDRSFMLEAASDIGEAIQLVRYAAVLKEKGAAQVVVRCAVRLAPLMMRARGVDGVVTERDHAATADFQADFASLPSLLATRLDDVPAFERYLAASPERSSAVAIGLAAGTGLRVGVAQAGGGKRVAGAPPASVFAPLAGIAGLRLIALQREAGNDRASMDGLPPLEALGDLAGAPGDLDDLAATIVNLDLVLTTDAAVAHLAAALGRPVFLVLPANPDWCWLSGRADSPWYPLLRLFRPEIDPVGQPSFSGVAERLGDALARLVAGDRSVLFADGAGGVAEAPLPDRNAIFRAARAHHLKGDVATARAGYAGLLADPPASADALHRLGSLALAEFDDRRALIFLRAAAGLGLGTTEFRTDYSTALRHAGQTGAAERLMVELVGERPTAEAELALGHIVRETGRFEEAADHYRRAIELRPDMARAHRSYGNALKDLNRCDEALAAFARAKEITPNDPELLLDEALTLLLSGDYRAGFARYEVRWRAMEMLPRRFDVPRWTGEAFAGRTLLVHAEQGIGDQLQYARFLKFAAARGGRLVVEVRPPLIDLLRRVDFGTDTVEFVEQGRRLPACDLEVPMMSLPGLFGADLGNLPAPLGLSVDPERVDVWRRSLGGAGKLRVGLVWQGNPNTRDDVGRSPPLDRLAPLFDVPGLHFVSLQYRDGLDQLRSSPLANRIEVVTERLAGFAETAAAMSAVDVVVTCATAAAHLAGSLGRRTFVMLRSNADWRWLTDRDDSPWYPSVRLFRQPRYGDWDSVAAAVASALARLTEAS